jgi:uncharacterized protein (DUF2249 family)
MTAEPIRITAGANAHEHEPAAATCTCGHDGSESMVLDSRTIPHAIRHAAIFDALEAIQPGISLDLMASHDPLPLLAQLERNHPNTFSITYLESGPDVWTLHLTRIL